MATINKVGPSPRACNATLPAAWPGFEARYRHRDTLYHIHVTNLGGGGGEVRRVVCDGVEQPRASIQLRDDGGEHHVEVEVGG